MKIADVWAEGQYRQVLSEEGTYESLAGYHLIAKTHDSENGYCDYYMHFHLFSDQDEAEKFAERVSAAGSINETHWDHVRRDVVSDVPYWATTEFAIREREGCL